MTHAVSLLLWSFALFELKHFFCDFVLQSAFMVRNKGIYGHRAGFIHAGMHAVGSLPAILLVTQNFAFIWIVVLGEFLVHYHVDWLKVYIDKADRWGDSQTVYWALFGADQLAHHLTYVAILAVIANTMQL